MWSCVFCRPLFLQLFAKNEKTFCLLLLLQTLREVKINNSLFSFRKDFFECTTFEKLIITSIRTFFRRKCNFKTLTDTEILPIEINSWKISQFVRIWDISKVCHLPLIKTCLKRSVNKCSYVNKYDHQCQKSPILYHYINRWICYNVPLK